jgi:hypothetical protein
MRKSMRPDDGVLHNETDRSGTFGKDAESNRERSLSDDDVSTQDHFTQAGVKRIEAVSKSWTTLSLVIAYIAYVYATPKISK